MTESGMKLVLWAVAAGLVGAMLAIPQPVDPWELPSLTLDRAAVEADLRRSRELAAQAPNGEEVDALQALFLAHGQAELNPTHTKVEHDNRQADIFRAIEVVEAVHGADSLRALRASAVEAFMALFEDGRGSFGTEEQAGLAGGFLQMLDKYGVIYRGVCIAPELTVRAMYKARWNLVHRAAATDGFTDVETQAYWGWLALHGWGAPLQERINALEKYHAAGGKNTREAAAIFELLAGRPEEAAGRLERLYDQDGELRIRNLALGALYAAGTAQR